MSLPMRSTKVTKIGTVSNQKLQYCSYLLQYKKATVVNNYDL